MQVKKILICIFVFLGTSSFAQVIDFSIYKEDANCKGSNNGQAEVNVVSTDPPYMYSWSNGSTNHMINGLAPGTYVCVVTDYSGNDTSVTIVINEIPCPIGAEQIFTPNADGYNDTWDIFGTFYYPELKVLVYNRWGQKVFESNGDYEPWDGKDRFGTPVPDNSYYYIIYGDKNDDGTIVKGSVSILR